MKWFITVILYGTMKAEYFVYDKYFSKVPDVKKKKPLHAISFHYYTRSNLQ